MKAKAFSVVLLFLIWSIVSGWVYICKIKQKCPKVEAVVELSPITFEKGSSTPIVNTNFKSSKTEILKRLGETNIVKIIGLYDVNESNSTSFENLGIARAMKVKQFFAEIPVERTVIEAVQKDFGTESTNLEAVRFKILVRNEYVEETDFGAILNMDLEDLDSVMPHKLEAYLTLLARESLVSKLDIIGHTDNLGEQGENYEDGLKLANAVRDVLISKGGKTDNITASSKGQTEPIADNSTESGRMSNKRVEILIN